MQNSVAATGDGNSVTAVFGDTGVRLPLERRQVPAPDRRRPPRPRGPPRELATFAPGAGALPLLGREADPGGVTRLAGRPGRYLRLAGLSV